MLRKPQYDSMLVRFFILEYVSYVLIEFFISMFLMYMNRFNVLYLVSKVIESSHNHRKVSVTHLAYLSVQKETSKLFKK